GDAGDHVGRAGPRRRDRHADLAAGAGVAVGHVRRPLLVADEDVADRIAEHRVVGRKDRAARVAEHVGHPFEDQRFPENLSTCSLHINLRHAITTKLTKARKTRKRKCGFRFVFLEFSCLSWLPHRCYPVTAPVDADDTSLAYLPSTPVA